MMVFLKARRWDRDNPAMPPVKPPYGSASIYEYKQPVIADRLNNSNEVFKFEMFEGWGIATLQSDHVLNITEKEVYRNMLQESGALLIGNLRLISQTLTRDKSIDDLTELFKDE